MLTLMLKSTKILIVILTACLLLFLIFRNVSVIESYAVYDTCTAEQIKQSCHADAVRQNWQGFIAPLSVFVGIVSILSYSLFRLIKLFIIKQYRS